MKIPAKKLRRHGGTVFHGRGEFSESQSSVYFPPTKRSLTAELAHTAANSEYTVPYPTIFACDGVNRPDYEMQVFTVSPGVRVGGKGMRLDRKNSGQGLIGRECGGGGGNSRRIGRPLSFLLYHVVVVTEASF